MCGVNPLRTNAYKQVANKSTFIYGPAQWLNWDIHTTCVQCTVNVNKFSCVCGCECGLQIQW